MPQAKYRRRSQRNRRREGSAKYVAPTAPDPTEFNTITVTGAGTAAANEVYTWDDTSGLWRGAGSNFIDRQSDSWFISDSSNFLYFAPTPNAVPGETGWTLGTGTAPAPTISYTG